MFTVPSPFFAIVVLNTGFAVPPVSTRSTVSRLADVEPSAGFTFVRVTMLINKVT
jgi:hypothetical protein